VASGEEGLRKAREIQPHIITVDLLMPGMDGWKVIRALKSEPALCHIPVVVVSVLARENSGRILGVVDVLQKPVAREELLAVFQRNLTGPMPRVLMVDDDPDARRILRSQLEEIGAKPYEAANGLEALTFLSSGPCDLILLDLVMPVIDGMTLLNLLRSDPRFQQLPVVVVTAKELTPEEKATLCRQTYGVFNKADMFGAKLRNLLLEFCAPARREPQGEALAALALQSELA
jgi:CheY-like chemotaxis protein